MEKNDLGKNLIWICCVLLTAISACDPTGDGEADGDDAFARIDRKLEAQFDLYDAAQEKIIEVVVGGDGAVSREEWETWLEPRPEDALEEDELDQIVSRQKQTVEDARRDAIEASVMDLELLRNDASLLEQYCRELPKGGMLHVHPSGTRVWQTVEEILQEVNPLVDGKAIVAEANDGELSILYPKEVELLSGLPVKRYLDFSADEQDKILALFFLPDDPLTHDFKRFEAIFVINDLLKQDETMEKWVDEKTYLDFLERAALQNVSYVEFTKVMWPDASTFDQLRDWAEKWYQESGIVVRWNSAFVRTLEYETNTQWTQELISLLADEQYEEIVGIDLLANETDTSALDTGQNIYIPVLAATRAGEINLHRTMHAGELGFVHNVRDAMIMGAERVGHGVLLDQDPIALEYAAEIISLPIETNIYSNYRLQVNDDFSKHPFLKFLRLGLPVSLSTDDEGMFVTDITNECEIAVANTDITYEELRQMSYNSIETAFAKEQVKNSLLERLDQDFTVFEKKWKQDLDKEE